MSEKPSPPKRQDYGFFHPLRVRWAELDPQGIVFNPNYLMYADVALFEYMRWADIDYTHMAEVLGVDMFMVNANANYFSSAMFDDAIEVGVSVTRLGRTSAVFGFAVFRGEEGLVSGELTYVFAAVGPDRTPTPIPESLRDKLSA